MPAKKKRVNRTDLTLRNLRALKSRLTAAEGRIMAIERWLARSLFISGDPILGIPPHVKSHARKK